MGVANTDVEWEEMEKLGQLGGGVKEYRKGVEGLDRGEIGGNSDPNKSHKWLHPVKL